MNVTTMRASPKSVRCLVVGLETVQNDVDRTGDLLVGKEILHVGTLITRKLDDLASILVQHNGTVAVEILLEGFHDALDVQVGLKTLDLQERCRVRIRSIDGRLVMQARPDAPPHVPW
jgi:hypothetical protein